MRQGVLPAPAPPSYAPAAPTNTAPAELAPVGACFNTGQNGYFVR